MTLRAIRRRAVLRVAMATILIAGLFSAVVRDEAPVSAAVRASTSTTTVAPSADVTTTNWSKGGTCTAGNYYTCVNDYADASGDSYIETTADRQTSVFYTLDLADMPTDFRSAVSVTVEAYATHYNTGPNGGVDTQKIGFDMLVGSTKIAASPTDQTLTTSYAHYSVTMQPNAYNDRTTWNGAQLKVYGKWSIVGTNDGGSKVRVASTRATINYLTVNGTLSQQRFILENDDGAGLADSNTQMAAGNTAIASVKKGERINARFQISNAASATNTNLGLFYDRNDGYWSRVMSSAPTPVVTGSNCDTDTKWVCGTVDAGPTGNFGWEHGIAIDHFGAPWISYYDYNSNAPRLKAAHYVGSGGNCGTSNAWTCAVVYDAAGDDGHESSIAIDNDNTVWIVFKSGNAGELTVANNRSATSSCTGGATGWFCDKVWTKGMTLSESSVPIAIGPNGKPAFALQIDSGTYMNLIQYVGSGGNCDDTKWEGCNDSPTLSIHAGVPSGLAFAPDGKPWISFRDGSTHKVKVARFRGLSGGGSCTNANWDCDLVDNNTNSTKSFSKVVFGGDGSAWVSYQYGNADFKFAHYVGSGGGSAAGCGTSSSAAWECMVADTTNTNAGGYSHLAISPDGYPWGVHYDANGNVRLARYDPFSTSGGNSAGCGTGSDSHMFCGDIHAAGDSGNEPVIAFAPDGTAWIAWGDDDNNDVKFSRLNLDVHMMMSPSATTSGSAISESHTDMTAVPDNSNRDDADCVTGTWANGKTFLDTGQISMTASTCTEVSFTIDTSVAWGNYTYRLMVVSDDGYDETDQLWRGTTATAAALGTLTIESATTTRYSKDTLASSSTACTASDWWCSSIDVTDQVGEKSQIAFAPDGTGWIAYNDATNGALKVAKYVGYGNGGVSCAGGSSAWSCSTIEQSSGHIYGSSSIGLAVDKDGAPWISYHDGDTGYKDLYVARYVGTGGSGCTGTAASAWTCMQVATLNNSGENSSLAFDVSGRPWVAYYEGNGGSGKLKTAHFDGPAGSSTGSTCSGTAAAQWTCLDVTTANDQGKQAAIATDITGNPWIVYNNTTSNVVAVARHVGFDGTGCGTGVTIWNCSTLDTSAGFSPAIAFSRTTGPWISYYTSGGNVKVAQYVGTSGAGCSGTTAWNCGTLDSNTPNTPGYVTSIAMDSNGLPSISYENVSMNKRKLARYAPLNGACGAGMFNNMFACTDISSSSGTYGEGTSVAFDGSGRAWVTTSRLDTDDLVVAIQAMPMWQPGYTPNNPNDSKNAGNGDLRHPLDFGKSPRSEGAGVCSSNTDLKGYCAVGTNDSIYDSMAATAYETPTYVFATRTASNASFPSYSWRGRSTVSPRTANVQLEVFRFGTTYGWVTLATNSTTTANVDFILTGTASAGTASEYWETEGSQYWTYYRVSQAADSSAKTLKTNYFGSVISNAAPSVAGSLAQYKSNGSTSISTGGTTDETSVVLKASVTDGDSGDTLYICAEVKPNATAFDGTGEVCGTAGVATGNTASVTVTGLANLTGHHWRVRTMDAQGSTSGWTQFNSGNLAFTTAANQAPNPPTALAQFKSNGTTGIPTNTLKNFDSTVGTMSEPNGGTLSIDNTIKRTGAGSLKDVTTNGLGGIWINDGNASTRDLSANGPTISAWVYVPAANSGGTWTAYLSVYEADGSTIHSGSNVGITRNTWTLVTYSPPRSLLSNMTYIAIGIAGSTGGTDTAYVDDLQQGYATWTNETSVVLESTVSDPDNPDTISLCAEVQPIATPFTNTDTNCGTGVSYSGTGVTASVTITGLASGTEYHWQVRSRDAGTLYSSYMSYGGNSESTVDIGVDTVAPTTTTIYDGTTEDVDTTYNSGSLTSLSANWDVFAETVSGIARYEYQIGTTLGGANVRTATNIDSNLTVNATGLTLQTGQVYYFRVTAYDLAGNSTTADSNGQYVAPMLTLNLSDSSLQFGSLRALNSYTANDSLTATVTTNAVNGYQLWQYTSGLLTSGVTTLPMYGGTWTTPTTWTGAGFGYTSSDTSVSGSNRFGGATLYAGIAVGGPGHVVADSSAASPNGDAHTLSYRISTTSTQAAGLYAGSLMFTALASF